MRCPNCDREEVDLLGESEVTGDTYGCPRCRIMFTVEVEKYEGVDESEAKAGWEEQAAKLKEGTAK
jgi:hypothetical protein